MKNNIAKTFTARAAAAACSAIMMLSAACLNAAAPGITVTATPEKNFMPAGRQQNAMINIAIITQARPAVEKKNRLNLAVALDRSGSMSGMRKLENAKAAAITALNMLSDDDYFSLVIYDDEAQVLIPSTKVSDTARREMTGKINSITCGGCTALFAGVAKAADEVNKVDDPAYVRRVVLLSDGIANVGPSSSDELGRLGAGLVKKGISVSSVGLGNDYNEDLMTNLSQKSDGNFYFVEKSSELSMIFEKELCSALSVAAKSVNLRITCPEGVTPKGVLGYDCRVNGQTIDIDFNQIYSGHRKDIVLQVEVPAGKEGAELTLASVSMKYENDSAVKMTLDGGRAQIKFSADEEKVKTSLNKDASAKIAIQSANKLRSEAIEAADKGDYKASREKMKSAQVILEDNASITMDEDVQAEAMIVKEDVGNVSDAKKFESKRKALKGDLYQKSNSQLYQQKK